MGLSVCSKCGIFLLLLIRNKEVKVVCLEAKLPVPLEWYLDSMCKVQPRGYDFWMEQYSGRNF